MKKVLIMVSMLVLAGCGSHYVIPASQTQPARVVSSSYTMGGCLENLQEQAKADNCELANHKMDSSAIWAEILLFPFIKGYTCTADESQTKITKQ